MARPGYNSEYRAKKELEKEFGKDKILKVAIGGATDFIVVCCGEVVKIVEVKEHHRTNYYPSPREKEQLKRIIKFAKSQHITAELWIYKCGKKGKPVIKTTKMLYEK